MRRCETCGKEISIFETIGINNKIQCFDCAEAELGIIQLEDTESKTGKIPPDHK